MISDSQLQQEFFIRKGLHQHITIIKALISYYVITQPDLSEDELIIKAIELFQFALKTKTTKQIEDMYDKAYKLLQYNDLLD